jgi:hypothetical protein
MFLLFHDGLAQFFVLVGLSGFPGGLWQFFVGAVVTGSYFVELVRLFFLFRVGLTNQFFCWRALSEAEGNNLLVGLFGRKILWLGVELAQFFVLLSGLLGFSIFFCAMAGTALLC